MVAGKAWGRSQTLALRKIRLERGTTQPHLLGCPEGWQLAAHTASHWQAPLAVVHANRSEFEPRKGYEEGATAKGHPLAARKTPPGDAKIRAAVGEGPLQRRSGLKRKRCWASWPRRGATAMVATRHRGLTAWGAVQTQPSQFVRAGCP